MVKAAKLRVLLVDGSPLTRFALASIVDIHPLTTICGEASDAPEARQMLSETQPDLLLLDLKLPRGDGLELLRECRKLHERMQVVVVSEQDDAASVHRAFRGGARAFVSKRDLPGESLAALDSVIAGKLYASRRVSHELLESMAHGLAGDETSMTSALSDRELHVFRLLGHGLGATAIAQQLGLSVKTIETHQGRIKDKLRAKTTAELRRRATRYVIGEE